MYLRPKKLFGILATLLILFASSELAAKTWLPMGEDELIASSDLIVKGKVVWVENGKVSTNSTDKASILVEEVWKGDPTTVMAPLLYPGRNRGYLTWNGKFNSTRDADDIYFDIDQEGIWFLEYDRKEQGYRIDHPARFKPLFFEKRFKRRILGH